MTLSFYKTNSLLNYKTSILTSVAKCAVMIFNPQFNGLQRESGGRIKDEN